MCGIENNPPPRPFAAPCPVVPQIFQQRVKNINNPPPTRRTKEEVQKDAVKARESHRKGHGHHQKRARKVAQPVASDGDGNVVEVRIMGSGGAELLYRGGTQESTASEKVLQSKGDGRGGNIAEVYKSQDGSRGRARVRGMVCSIEQSVKAAMTKPAAVETDGKARALMSMPVQFFSCSFGTGFWHGVELFHGRTWW